MQTPLDIQAEQMPTEELLVMGSSIVNNPLGWAYNYPGQENDFVYVQGGESVFEPDDVVVFVVDNVEGGELHNNSRIVEIIVYDSAQDYVNGTPLYTYDNMGGRGQGNIVNGAVRGMGDTYLNVRVDNFESTDPDAPDINQLFIAPGVDLSDGIPDVIYQDTDYDYNGDGTIDGGQEDGNDAFNIDNNIFAEEIINGVVCLTRGTLIDTPDGPKYIETLREGDLVNTLDAGPQEIRWIGSRSVPAKGNLAPVRIRAGALGNIRDMKVSPNHRMLIRGPKAEMLFGERDVLVAAKHLVNDETIRVEEGGWVDYFHMLFDDHQIIFAEACPTESLFPGEQALDSVDAAARAEILTLFPELAEGDHDAALSRYELKAWEAAALRAAG